MNPGDGGLYDGRGLAIGRAPPFYGPDGILYRRTRGQVICLADEPACQGMSRVWALPAAGAPRPVPRRILGELVAALDLGMPVAILGVDLVAVREAVAAVLQMTGGFDA